MENLPTFIGIVFGLTTILTVLFFYKAATYSKTVLYVLCGWLLMQAFIGLTGFYTLTDTMPPRLALAVAPMFIAIAILFFTAQGRIFIDSLDTKTLTLLHTVRIPVEIVLFWLFLEGTVPQLMTFEGRNFDIISGITAPLVWYFGFVKNKLSPKLILIWNFICLGLLLNIVINAILSAPFPTQQFAFDQPNIAVLYFPFVWLPGCVVPLVLLSHLVVIRRLIRS
ncbi:MAG: hypothetical protein ACKVQB_09940 [Bacteroidia bacterium]